MGCGASAQQQPNSTAPEKPPKEKIKKENPKEKDEETRNEKELKENNKNECDSSVSIDTEILPSDCPQPHSANAPPARSKSFCGTEHTRSMKALESLAAKREQEEREQEERQARRQSAGDADLDEFFMFGDFQVPVKKELPKKKVDPELKLVDADLEQQIVKEYLESKYFAYTDFQINLEDMILDPANAESGGPPTNDKAAYQFAFGDFGIGVSETEIKAANANNGKHHSDIHNFKIRHLLGHATRVKCICISHNEKFYVSSSAKDAIIIMYDLKSGREILYFDGHEDTIIGAHFSSDGKHLATASRDNTLILWDTVIGKQIFVFEHERIVICCCFSWDGKYIVSGCQDKVCRVWSTKKGKELRAFKEHEGIITAVSYAPNGDTIVSASSDRSLMVWSSSTGVCTVVIKEHSGIVMSCMYSIDGSYIVSNDEKAINVWDIKKQKVSLHLTVDDVPFQGSMEGIKKRTWTICSCCPGPFSFYIVAACSDRNVYILHPQTGNVVLTFFCRAAVYCLSSGLRNTLALGDAYGNIYIVTLR
eukprot:NODE_261_length_1896_cov_312.192204_g211_i0.p1 GENE.NODE_261_length_1896_cov_312.192204_g211_i0~~NODE_261_length_1896_cov_312.192204_g211_i0.p1  ORF type:complete len:537 (-),score=136.45 NODE_261_length_1896_cov_312.192204_g211_i0:200-1810(-)